MQLEGMGLYTQRRSEMTNWKEHKELQEAVKNYLIEYDLGLEHQFEYDPIIDGVYVCVSGHPVLLVGLPPVSNYSIDETEYTDKYLRKAKVA